MIHGNDSFSNRFRRLSNPSIYPSILYANVVDVPPSEHLGKTIPHHKKTIIPLEI